MATPEQRFLALTDKDSGDCWLWTGEPAPMPESLRDAISQKETA